MKAASTEVYTKETWKDRPRWFRDWLQQSIPDAGKISDSGRKSFVHINRRST